MFILHDSFSSQYIPPRQIEIWLPEDYEQHPAQHFPVLYMHDGQNLFHPELSIQTGVCWGVDQAISRLSKEGAIRPAIVVGIWNAGVDRWREYMPQKAYQLLTPRAKGAFRLRNGVPYSDRYLKFIVEELKPWVDTTYRTLPSQQDTFIMGSSMGGLISMYAVCEYPGIFGGAGCLSTHWIAGEGIAVKYLAKHVPPPEDHKFYFDHGTKGLDAGYEPYQVEADKVMRSSGYTQGTNWASFVFPGHDHNESAWNSRLQIPLQFQLGGS